MRWGDVVEEQGMLGKTAASKRVLKVTCTPIPGTDRHTVEMLKLMQSSPKVEKKEKLVKY